jgi:hypothetical protein
LEGVTAPHARLGWECPLVFEEGYVENVGHARQVPYD